MMIGLGSDHNGFALKQRLCSYLAERGVRVRDFGTFSDEPMDYPDVAVAVAEAVQAGLIERGILVCGTGLGMAIAANKVPGIFAATVADLYTARKARESNNAQIITLGANTLGMGVGLNLQCREAMIGGDVGRHDSLTPETAARSLSPLPRNGGSGEGRTAANSTHRASRACLLSRPACRQSEAAAIGLACEIVEAWLAAEFLGGRSARKVSKIRALEERYRSQAAAGVLVGG